MESLLRSVYGRAEAEYVIKKSRFIATVCEVKTEAEAAAFIESVRKHYLGRPAQLLGLPNRSRRQIQRSSDDGEPSGTAGRPHFGSLKETGPYQYGRRRHPLFRRHQTRRQRPHPAYSHAAALALDEASVVDYTPSRSLRRPSPIPWSAPLNALPKVTASSSPTGPLPPT